MILKTKQIQVPNKIEKFIPFLSNTKGIDTPSQFPFPFYYDVHPLAKIATDELQNYLTYQTDFKHYFHSEKGIGKMFGVLVVKNSEGELGYLAAFSGKLAESNIHKHFVPPVFDMLKEDGFFMQKEPYINQLNEDIKQIEESEKFKTLLSDFETTERERELKIQEQKLEMKEKKSVRDFARFELALMPKEELDAMAAESSKDKILLQNMKRHYKHRIDAINTELIPLQEKLKKLREARKTASNQLQHEIFNSYVFLNAKQEKRSLGEIFNNNPPAGAGECAAPKLLQYAFLNNLKPITMAEFWWGIAPKSSIRKQGNYYPACIAKCEPILGFMLNQTATDANTFKINPALEKELPIVYEDDDLLVVNKPEEFLSVPGKNYTDSVQERIQKKYPKATGPIVVHRLDMSTSGLLLVAKKKEIHKALQAQFINKTIVKRYEAVLDGFLTTEEGEISLPLCLDYEDRPRQMVCFEKGRTATTKYKKIAEENGKTRVHLFPITGRTHQLRVHCAHSSGLGLPIVGDDLYGTKTNRLHLHAAYLKFWHPTQNKEIELHFPAPF